VEFRRLSFAEKPRIFAWLCSAGREVRNSAASNLYFPATTMTNYKRWLFCILALVVLFAASCKRHDKNEFKPSKLAAGLFSGQSLQTAERKLDMMAGNFDIMEDRTPLPSDGRPPYRLLVISKKNIRVDGQMGELVLTFFNDRLMTSQFYPVDLAAERTAVEAGQQISLGSGDSHIQPSTRVWVGKDESGRSYIGWIDKSLQAEQDAWVKQYGQ
jgi:hypothetical protein